MDYEFNKKYWPLGNLQICIDELVLTEINDSNLQALVELTLDGIVDVEKGENLFMPSEFFMTFGNETEVDLAFNFISYQYGNKHNFKPTSPEFMFCVNLKDGDKLIPIGIQAIHPRDDFEVLRGYNSGSWLGKEYHGKGYGKKMRMAVLHFGFSFMDCNWITTGHHPDNVASKKITLAMGYTQSGVEYTASQKTKKNVKYLRYILEKETWLNSDVARLAGESVSVKGWEDLSTWLESFVK